MTENPEMSSELFSGSANARTGDRVAAVLPSNYGSTPQATVIDGRSVNGNLSLRVWACYCLLTVDRHKVDRIKCVIAKSTTL